MDTVQIKGIDSTDRVTNADLKAGAKLEISEKLMTHGEQNGQNDIFCGLKWGGQQRQCGFPFRSQRKIFSGFSGEDLRKYGLQDTVSVTPSLWMTPE